MDLATRSFSFDDRPTLSQFLLRAPEALPARQPPASEPARGHGHAYGHGSASGASARADGPEHQQNQRPSTDSRPAFGGDFQSSLADWAQRDHEADLASGRRGRSARESRAREDQQREDRDYSRSDSDTRVPNWNPIWYASTVRRPSSGSLAFPGEGAIATVAPPSADSGDRVSPTGGILAADRLAADDAVLGDREDASPDFTPAANALDRTTRWIPEATAIPLVDPPISLPTLPDTAPDSAPDLRRLAGEPEEQAASVAPSLSLTSASSSLPQLSPATAQPLSSRDPDEAPRPDATELETGRAPTSRNPAREGLWPPPGAAELEPGDRLRSLLAGAYRAESKAPASGRLAFVARLAPDPLAPNPPARGPIEPQAIPLLPAPANPADSLATHPGAAGAGPIQAMLPAEAGEAPRTGQVVTEASPAEHPGKRHVGRFQDTELPWAGECGTPAAQSLASGVSGDAEAHEGQAGDARQRGEGGERSPAGFRVRGVGGEPGAAKGAAQAAFATLVTPEVGRTGAYRATGSSPAPPSSPTTGPTSFEPAPERLSAPPRELVLTIRSATDGDAALASVHVRDQNGNVEIAVRTVDTQLSTSLQDGLPDLVSRLESPGFVASAALGDGADAHSPEGNRSGDENQSGRQSEDAGREHPEGEARGQSRQPRRERRARWQSTLGAAVQPRR